MDSRFLFSDRVTFVDVMVALIDRGVDPLKIIFIYCDLFNFKDLWQRDQEKIVCFLNYFAQIIKTSNTVFFVNKIHFYHWTWICNVASIE